MLSEETFETYVSNSTHAQALTAAQAAAEGTAFRPLYFHGTTGVGKTHFLRAIGHRARQTRPEARIRYLTAEQLVHEMIEWGPKPWRWQGELWLLDGLEHTADRPRTLEAVCDLVDQRQETGTQVVLASSWPLDDFSRRWPGGLMLELKQPREADLIEILRQRSATIGLKAAPEVLHSIVTCVQSRDVRVCSGALNRVLAWCSLLGQPLTAQSVGQALCRSGL